MGVPSASVVRAVIAGLLVSICCVCVPGIGAEPQEQTRDKTATAASASEELAPDSAYISPTKYTNAFFGFSMELPKELRWGTLSVNNGRQTDYFLCGALVMRATKLTMVSLSAKTPEGDPEEEAQKFVGRGKRKIRVVEIAGKKFWIAEETTTKNGIKMRDVSYATPLNGLVLEIDVFSGDSKLTQEIERSVQEIQFFDPAKAAEKAGPDSKPFLTTRAHMAEANKRLEQLDMGSVTGNVYKNEDLGFAYEFPAGWIANDRVTRDRAVEEGHPKAWGNDAGAAREHEAMKECTRTVFAATRYPLGSKQFENSTAQELIYIMVVDPVCIPRAKFPASVDDQETLRQMGEDELQWFEHGKANSPVKPAVDGFEVQGHLMVQISESLAGRTDGNASKESEVLMAREITQLKGYWVAWNFMSASQAEMDEMLKTRIKFDDVAGTQGSAAQGAQPAATTQPKQ